jgi:murein DD-endopeptidase MepM/ murein hydrolase activator NlpD
MCATTRFGDFMSWTPSAGALARTTGRARRKRFAAALSVLGVLVTASVVASAPVAANAASYPSWGDVQQAKASQAAKQAEINQLQGLINSLDAQVTATQAEAKTKGDAYATAQDAYYAAAVQEQALEKQADAAKALSKKSEAQAGQLAAQLARSGSSGSGGFQLNLFLNGKDAAKVLDGIGDGGRVSARADGVYKQALQDQKAAQALTDQANVAKGILNNLKAIAQTAYEVAQKAADAAQAALDAQTAHKAELQAQLASLTTNLNLTEAEYEAGIKAEFGADGTTEISSSGWALPTLGLITSGFGMRVNPFNGAYQLHDGTDMAHGCSQPIYAGHAGTVDYAGWYGALGEFIRIQNDGTYSTAYGHIAAGQILVHDGEQIHVGQLIARTGETGTATGCHLHYMVIINGVPVNAVPFMRNEGIVLGQA